MPFSTVDTNTALIVVDLQAGIVGLPLAHPVEGVIARSTELIGAFRRHGLPVALVNVAGAPPGRTERGATGGGRVRPEGWTDLIPELDQQPDDIAVTKYARSAFSGTDLAAQLRARGVTQVVVVGIATGSGVESTARSAHEDGFHVSLPVDAMTDGSPDTHEHSVTKVFPKIAETGTTAELLALLEGSRP